MSGQRRRSGRRRSKGGSRTAPPAEFWRAAPEPPEPPDIRPADDPTALLRSMGPPPLPGQNDALLTMCLVVTEAQKAARALAYSADLLELDDPT
jgi:hypothetical protein